MAPLYHQVEQQSHQKPRKGRVQGRREATEEREEREDALNITGGNLKYTIAGEEEGQQRSGRKGRKPFISREETLNI